MCSMLRGTQPLELVVLLKEAFTELPIADIANCQLERVTVGEVIAEEPVKSELHVLAKSAKHGTSLGPVARVRVDYAIS